MVCGCPNAYKRVHLSDCKWFNRFLLECIDLDHEDQCTRSVNDNEEEVCCCSVDVFHNESAKIKLLYLGNDPKYGDETVFPNLESGIIKMENHDYFGSVKYQSIILLGQNRLIHELNRKLFKENKRVIYLVGDKSSGKTTISKFFSNHMQERHKFESFHSYNIPNSEKVNTLKSKLKSNLTGYHNWNDVDEKRKQERSLIILDNADYLLETQWEEVQQMISECVEQTKMSFILTIRDMKSFGLLKNYQVVKEIPPLNPQMAAKFFKMYVESNLLMREKNIYELVESVVFKMKLYMPQDLLGLIDSIRNGKSFRKLEEEVEFKAATSGSDSISSNIIKSNPDNRPIQPAAADFEEELIEVILK